MIKKCEMSDEVCEPEPPRKLDLKAYYPKTATLNHVSRGSTLNGPQNIFMPGGKCVIQQATLRADVAKITLGKCCYVAKGVLLHPPSYGAGFLPLTVGEFVWLGEDAVVRAASIGSCVRVGLKAVLGERCIVKDCCWIMDGAVVPPDTVLAPYTCWAGSPAKLVRTLPESFGRTQEWELEQNFADLCL
jgi:dynactin-5